jgi:hypothetical protein
MIDKYEETSGNEHSSGFGIYAQERQYYSENFLPHGHGFLWICIYRRIGTYRAVEF